MSAVLYAGFAMGDAGVVVDTHVDRVARRLGWVGGGAAAKKGPEATRKVRPAGGVHTEWANQTPAEL